MKITAMCLCLFTAVATGSAAAQVSAEPWFRGGTWMLTVEVGGAAFTDFERTQARPVATEIDLGDFSRRVSARTAGSVGGWGSYWIGNGWGIRAGAAYVPSSFTVWNDKTVRDALDTAAPPGSEEVSYASLDVWMAHAALVFRFPRSFGRVVPYGVAGGGLIRYHVSGDAEVPPEARGRFSEGDIQTGAGMFGVGATIPLQRRNLLMSFELTNHMSRTPLGQESAGELFELYGVSMQVDPDPGTSGEYDVAMTSHVRLSLGLTLPLR
ncbi:MAG: hypothetical protein KFH98_07765 [Gemmatimonadetes bacterium]|nr:hypothetical protein [Gemmatimonadota bacterium]